MIFFLSELLNYEDAKSHCEDLGARLCTKAEFEHDCARDTGCTYDWTLLWTSENRTCRLPACLANSIISILKRHRCRNNTAGNGPSAHTHNSVSYRSLRIHYQTSNACQRQIFCVRFFA